MTMPKDEPHPEELDLMLGDVFANFDGPIVAGFPAGHCDPFVTLPLGCRARLDTEARSFVVEESLLAEESAVA